MLMHHPSVQSRKTTHCSPAPQGASPSLQDSAPYAVIATKEAIPVCIGDCVTAFAMTAHGALSCNDRHTYQKRHVEMHPCILRVSVLKIRERGDGEAPCST
jgi:hypothetical protein